MDKDDEQHLMLDHVHCRICGCRIEDVVLDTRFLVCVIPCHCGALAMVHRASIVIEDDAEQPSPPVPSGWASFLR